MPILSLGTIALDRVSTPAGRVEEAVGGSAVFFCAAASLLSEVRVVGVVGDDYPLLELDFLRERGVDFGGVAQLPGPSFFWSGEYSEDFRSRTTLETRPGVLADFDPRVPEGWRDSTMIFLGNTDPGLQLALLDRTEGPSLVVADTMNYWIEETREALMRLLARIDVLLVNDEEAVQLSGADDLAKAAACIRSLGPSVVVIKRGEAGATLYGAGWSHSCPSFAPDRLRDPTGAGDAFAGGFMGRLEREGRHDRVALCRAAAFGAAAGSFAVEDFSVERFRSLTVDELAARARAIALAAPPPAGTSGAEAARLSGRQR
ncbi:MAG: PfkB family carbohydrate kinase [Gemmatimonadetes bacterium]|nr:PfkB family carbohydrate kinase [Gemmatimonadota bacterium]MCY3942811.1 PfkB family carbohydrate kinase [Gemmatimonadota bacterium]